MRDVEAHRKCGTVPREVHRTVQVGARQAADLANGLFGEPEILAGYGEVPDME